MSIDPNVHSMLEFVKQTADFTKEQVPLYVSELLRFGLLKHSIGTVLCVGSIMFLGYWFKRNKDLRPFIIMALFILFVPTMTNIYNLIQITIAPRVYVLQEVSKQIGFTYEK